tara:strand:- start:726 stop:995 length:270 start_codon:yes stop_codon:yes gene_type:complete
MDQNSLLSFIQIGGKKVKGNNKPNYKGGKKSLKRGSKRGGSVLADVSVPAGLLFLNEFLKRRKANSKKVKFSKKRKVTRKVTRKVNKKK